MTLLAFEAELPELTQRIAPAGALPPAKEDAFVYVIGHPAGAGLKLSIRGNDLLAYDEEKVKVHYMAPTEGGSSGSPVFNAAWELIAVHHAGSEHMPRLDDDGERYKANEGITLDAIRKEYVKTVS